MGGQKVRRGRESFGNGMGEGGKGVLGSGVEYCGICLNGVREVIGGYRGTWLEVVRVVMGSTAVSGNRGLEW